MWRRLLLLLNKVWDVEQSKGWCAITEHFLFLHPALPVRSWVRLGLKKWDGLDHMVRDTDGTPLGSLQAKLLRERWVSLSLPGFFFFFCYFYFSYDPFPTQGFQKPYLPLAAPGDPNSSLWAEPHLPHRNLLFLYVCVSSDALNLCQIATVLCLSLPSTLDIN